MGSEALATVLAVTLVGTAWALWLLPVGVCGECPHCRLERFKKDRKADAAIGRVYGIPLCQACGRHHPKGDPHLT